MRLFKEGERITTFNGREITFPKTTGRINRRLQQVDEWLHKEALEEIKLYPSNQRDFLEVQLKNMKLNGVVKLTRSDRDVLNDILFSFAPQELKV